MKRPILERVAEELTRRYTRALGSNLVALAFFGSWARGEETESSDLDILLIASELPDHPLERNRLIYEPLQGWKGKPCSISVLARTVREFTADITPLHLDLAADAIIFYDPQGFLKAKLDQVRGIIAQARLVRERDAYGLWAWWWEKGAEPSGRWAITWAGVQK
ncbi:MAG: nucleotidyltransferase domain-containing protein [Thermoflexales bacterium]|nr:nucleotidyltransferase domain-containing protein [Thermoflexales bacterium]